MRVSLFANIHLGIGRKGTAAIVLMLLLVSWNSLTAQAGVIGKDDLDQVATLKTNFSLIIGDVGKALRETDLSEPDRYCVNTISQDLLQVGQELASYENLMKIETQLNTFSDEGTTREVVLYALNTALAVLAAERKRLVEPPDHCANLPVSSVKARSVLRVIEGAIATLHAVRARL